LSQRKPGYVGGSERDGAEYWLERVGWEPTEVAKAIAQNNTPSKTGLIVDIGGAHGREALWLAEQGFLSILVEPNSYSLRFAAERARSKGVDVALIDSVLPCLPIRPDIAEMVDFYWTLHQLSDDQKRESLKEVHRIVKPRGLLYSTSFGHWEGHAMPASIHPITEKQTFLDLHVSAGFRPRYRIEERADSSVPYEKFWYGVFEKIP
jgi:SAM-dependent methyltransferase